MSLSFFRLKAPVIVAACLWMSACTKTEPASAPAAAEPDSTALVARGAYLVTIAGCNDCHSPKQMGPNGPELVPGRMLSGYRQDQPIPEFDSKMLSQGYAMFTPDLTAAAGPWGISFAGNLTPDDTGIKNWSFEQFRIALTKGKYKGLEGARDLLPPMPWVNYIHMEESDLKAMFAYLKSIPPVENVVPAPVPLKGS